MPPVDFDPYGMDANLHMKDLKHTMDDERRSGEERRHEPQATAEERRAGGERRHVSDKQGRPAMNALVIFGLLAVLMLTGMPISISLGLTVLTFLFTMTQVPLESVALKLFTGIEKFEIMAIPVLHPGR